MDLKPPVAGCFAIDESILNWQKCREQFASKFNDDPKGGLYFAHDRGIHNSEKVALFLGKIEDILELKERSTYSKCNLNFAVWISLSSFWTQCVIKKSLLTILIRCSQRFDVFQNNFEDALFSPDPGGGYLIYDYSSDTKIAIQRFLFGFTKYVGQGSIANLGHTTGWWSIFKNKTKDQVRMDLVHPENLSEKSIVGIGSLWM